MGLIGREVPGRLPGADRKLELDPVRGRGAGTGRDSAPRSIILEELRRMPGLGSGGLGEVGRTRVLLPMGGRGALRALPGRLLRRDAS